METAQRKLEFRSRLYALAVKRLGAGYNDLTATLVNISDYYQNYCDGSTDETQFRDAVRRVFDEADAPLPHADIAGPDIGADPSLMSDNPRATTIKH